MQISLYQADAFTNALFGGNPAAVCPLDRWLSDELLQAIAAENNLSETAFIVPKGKDYHIRWFTPTTEVDLCGHATLASAHILYTHLGETAATLHFESRSGQLSVSLDGELYIMDFPVDMLEPTLAPTVLKKALAIEPEDVFVGRDDYLIVVDSQKTVEALEPDFRMLKQVKSRGVIVTAPGEKVDFVSRCFFPNAGIDEDPVTGSAHTSMTPYWAERLSKQSLSASQLSKRGGHLHCTMLGDRVAIAGQAVTFMEGKIFIPN